MSSAAHRLASWPASVALVRKTTAGAVVALELGAVEVGAGHQVEHHVGRGGAQVTLERAEVEYVELGMARGVELERLRVQLSKAGPDQA